MKKVGDKIKFQTPYGIDPGEHEGKVERVLYQGRFNLYPGKFWGYDVKVYLPAHHCFTYMLVKPSMIIS